VRNRLFLLIRETPGMVFGEIYEEFRPIAERVTGKNFPAASLTRMLITLRDLQILRTNLPEHLLTRGRSPQYYVNAEFTDKVLDAYLEALQALRDSNSQT
jgi:hypothetical protein